MSVQFERLRHSRDCVRSHLPASYDRGGEVLTLGACTCGRDEIVGQAVEQIARLRTENEALRLKAEGQDLLLRAYRLGTRPPERAFKLLARAAKALGE